MKTKKAKTNKGEYNAIITEAEKINAQLRKLEQKAQDLAERIAEFGDAYDYDTYIYELRNLELTLQDLAAFDLEDSIPERARCNF